MFVGSLFVCLFDGWFVGLRVGLFSWWGGSCIVANPISMYVPRPCPAGFKAKATGQQHAKCINMLCCYAIPHV